MYFRKTFKFVFIALIALAFVANAQCKDNPLKNILTLIGESNFIKDYKVVLGRDETSSQQALLTRGVKYKVYVHSEDEAKARLVCNIESTGRLIASSYDSKTNKFYQELEFVCMKTGMYDFKFNYFKGFAGCGMVVLAIAKPNVALKPN